MPIARAGYGGNRRDQSVLPLDWGILTPLWFLGHGRNMPGHGNVLADPPADDIGPPAVIVTPSRSLPRQALVDFGHPVAEVSAAEPRRIGFIASCDWGHAHAEAGPYGFHDESARVDAEVVAAVQANDLMRLMDLDEGRAKDAAIDGLWQALMLLGAFAVTPMNVELLSYEAPTYYGMLVAVWRRERGDLGAPSGHIPFFRRHVSCVALQRG